MPNGEQVWLSTCRFLVPIAMVISKDIAYVSGMLFGKTRLIKISPNKT